ncbi:hypothetical protein [Halocalculus aciditolerans]|uniref:Uncharacterized protein n=1 Tax=Halocalculus aciditolerans TaxID=1383812 RepID=A0A830F1L5_9EURY|nr:hypothetical protein [Halocalculus aciditolerans]GGL53640.1 hypothetical protein GCM10009039_09790 [Halocalculus aciditolerans]
MSAFSLIIFVPAIAIAGIAGYVLADEYEDRLRSWYAIVEDLLWLVEIAFILSWFALLTQQGFGGLVVAVLGSLAIGGYFYFDER